MKKVLLFIAVFLININVYASNESFSTDYDLSFVKSKNYKISNSFNKLYKIDYNKNKNEYEDEIVELTKKTTALLLGDFNSSTETTKEYYKRHNKYLNLMYNKKIPKDKNSLSGYKEDSQEYKDFLVASTAVPSIFLMLNELDIKYNSYGSINVNFYNDIAISELILENVQIKKENSKNPQKYDYIKTNLVLYYYYKKQDDNYKLYYLYGNTLSDVNKYLEDVSTNEVKNRMEISGYSEGLSSIYDFTSLENMSNDDFNNIYNANINNLVTITSYYNNEKKQASNGFFLTNDIVVTSWNFIKEALESSQYISVQGSNNTNISLDGIVTIDVENDLALLKVKNDQKRYVEISDTKVNINDPVVVISSKTGQRFSIQKGIVLANDNSLNISIPLTKEDCGSALFDKNGKAIGIISNNFSKNTSYARNGELLKKLQDKFLNINYDKIDFIEFSKLKEQYYYVEEGKEKKTNSIPKNKWNTYKKVGNIDKNIKLKLVKANYKDGIVSLRYKNSISKYFGSMQVASSFIEELLNSNYKEVLSTATKSIYESNNYKVVIMDEFDYLIVVIIKK